MKKIIAVVMIFAFAIFALSAVCYAQTKTAPAAKKAPAAKTTPAAKTAVKTPPPATNGNQTLCLCVKKVDKQFFIDANGKRIYTCSKACKDLVAKNPAKAIKTLEAKGQKLEILVPPSKPLPNPAPPAQSPAAPKAK
jgi:uncharacterized secreted protein with C-terminal beta-propeller domain